ncbi:uncharacterized protein LOC132613134 [Lycium barbarum]|uniref:uncharacterized protein LOC132613134 n=1 Tax=Lycium barbarum TaxID=112863 RepID=UPI00293F79C6|nr:uncharacterized protein LOC132613134 [Lycium barbarum]
MKEDENFWDYTAPTDCSWYWKRLNKLKLDMRRWYNADRYNLTPSGKQSIAKGYYDMIGAGQAMETSTLTWSKILQPKHRFILWLAAQRKLLTRGRLESMGIECANTECELCDMHAHEDSNHLFKDCTWAVGMCQAMNDWTKLQLPKTNIVDVLKLIKQKHCPRMKKEIVAAVLGAMIYHGMKHQTTPLFVEHWTLEMLFQVKITLGKIFSIVNEGWNWELVCDIAINYRQSITSKLVLWECAEQYSFILNTNGSCSPSLSKAGAGGIVRKINGDLIMASAKPLQFLTNKSSEIQAALHGLKWCHQKNLSDFLIQLNSLFVAQMIQGKSKVPWTYQKLIEENKKIVTQRNVKVIRCYREANMVADALSKFFNNLAQEKFYYQEGDLPAEALGPLRMDKMGIPSFRIRPAKHTGRAVEKEKQQKLKGKSEDKGAENEQSNNHNEGKD